MPGMEREEMQEEPGTRLESERYKVLSTSFQVMLEHQDRNRTAVETRVARLSHLDRNSPITDPPQPSGRLFHFSKSCTPCTQTDHDCTSLTHPSAVENQCEEKTTLSNDHPSASPKLIMAR